MHEKHKKILHSVHTGTNLNKCHVTNMYPEGVCPPSSYVKMFFCFHSINFSIGIFCIFHCVSVESTSMFPSSGASPPDSTGAVPLDPAGGLPSSMRPLSLLMESCPPLRKFLVTPLMTNVR